MQTFDIAVIGGGPGGYTAALRAVTGGKSVVLFEGEEVGGTCLNKGCIPTKALLSMAKRYAEARENGGYISYSELAFDLEKADEIKNSRVAKLHENLTKYLASSKIVIIKAHAEFIAPNANIADSEKKKSVGGGTGEISPYFILAAGETYRSEYVVIASGSVCATPPIDGIEHAFSSDKLTKKITPAREIAVIGGGVVGLEFTSFYTAVGAKVTMILMEEKPLITYEKDISQTVGMLLKKKGVSIYGNSVVKKIEKTEAGFCVRFESAGEEKTVECDTVIDASGRRAVTEGLGLEKVGILYDKKGIYTDENMRTNLPKIFAVGDAVRGNIQLAHKAAFDAERVAEYILNGTPVKKAVVPICIYTAPEVASAGLKSEDCVREGIEYVTAKAMLGANGKAVAVGAESGFVKVIFAKIDAPEKAVNVPYFEERKDKFRLVGAHIVAENSSEMIGGIAALIEAGAEREDILNTIFPHPSLSESFREAVEKLRIES